MKIRVLIDNRPSECGMLAAEHGLSFYIEFEDVKILCDMGLGDGFLRNARALGIELAEVDFGVVSHAHSDHIGGLPSFLEAVSDVRVFLSEDIFRSMYFSTRRGVKRDLSPDFAALEEYSNRLVRLAGSSWLCRNVAMVDCSGVRSSELYGNSFLFREFPDGRIVPDDFRHEMALAFVTSQGLVIVSSCSHNGIGDIMHRCCEFTGESRVYAFIGGLHIVDGPCIEQEVERVCRLIAGYPSVKVVTGHCTCLDAQRLFLQRGGVECFYTGSLYCLDE